MNKKSTVDLIHGPILPSLIARLYGARNFTKIKEAVAATWILGAILSALVMLMGFFGLYPLLEYLETPAEILPPIL